MNWVIISFLVPFRRKFVYGFQVALIFSSGIVQKIPKQKLYDRKKQKYALSLICEIFLHVQTYAISKRIKQE